MINNSYLKNLLKNQNNMKKMQMINLMKLMKKQKINTDQKEHSVKLYLVDIKIKKMQHKNSILNIIYLK